MMIQERHRSLNFLEPRRHEKLLRCLYRPWDFYLNIMQPFLNLGESEIFFARQSSAKISNLEIALHPWIDLFYLET